MKSTILPLGYAIWIDDPHWAGQIIPRSSLGAKRGVVIGNLVGLIDSDYQGELKICLLNRTSEALVVYPEEPIAQMIFTQVATPQFITVKDFKASTQRGAGGFGSTRGGKK